MAQNDTFFTNDTGSASGPTDYIKDTQSDVTLTPTNNTGLTSSAGTNPIGDLFNDTQAVTYGAKTLWIKDLVLIEDRSKWVSNKPTYRVIWHENFPGVNGYVFGEIRDISEYNQPVVTFRNPSEGFGVGGAIRKVMFLVNNSAFTTATAQVQVDGVNTTTVSFGDISSSTDGTRNARYSAFVHAGANETNDLHDFRLLAIEANTLQINGVVVYYENSGQNIDIRPGSTYVDKSKVTTTSGATLPLPSYGSSLGGRMLIYQTQTSGFAASALSASTIVSIAQGSSGTNLLTVSTGHGSSFPVGSGLVAGLGSTNYVGAVSSISTDTLTVSPTLSFGVSAGVYRAWLAGPTYAINASLMRLVNKVDLSLFPGITSALMSLRDGYCAWSRNTGNTTSNGQNALFFKGASGCLQVDGRFAAAEIETVGSGIFGATIAVNGIPAWSISEGVTGIMRKTIFTDSGPGAWNSFNICPSASMAILGIRSVNLYDWSYDRGQTFGQLAAVNTLPAYANRNAANATIMAWGLYQRLYADQLYLAGTWTRSAGATAVAAHFYYGLSGSFAKIQYYGKDFAVLGTPDGGTLALNGAGIGLTFGFMHSIATLGFHTVQYNTGNGSTAKIEGFDFVRPIGEVKSLHNVHAPKSVTPNNDELWLATGNGSGSLNTPIRRFLNVYRKNGDGYDYLDSAINGMSVTIIRGGIFFVSYTDYDSTGPFPIGISVNSNQLTTAFTSIRDSDKIVSTDTPVAGIAGTASGVARLQAGDVIRAHGPANMNGTAQVHFHLTRIGD